MNNNTKVAGPTSKPVGADFFNRIREESWTYIKTVVDVVREPVIILDQELRVMTANESFYQTFRVEPADTEHQVVYELGNGQWNIPALRKLLEDILPKNTFFKGFEVSHEFPFIGHKVMILNARQIHFKESAAIEHLPPIIMLAIEDVTEMMAIAETLAGRANQLEVKLTEKTLELEKHIIRLEKEVRELKNKS